MYEDRYFVMIDESDLNFGHCYRFYGEENDKFELHAELMGEQTEWIDKRKVMEISEDDYEFYLNHYHDELTIRHFASQFISSMQPV